MDLAPVATGESPGKDAVWCEWDWANPAPGGKISAIRTDRYRLVFYQALEEGELYDHRDDPGEIHNRWDDPEYADARRDLTDRLMRFTMAYRPETSFRGDRRADAETRYAPTRLLHKHKRYWSKLKKAYEEPTAWPPE